METVRAKLEELDCIEQQLATRIAKSDQFLPEKLQAGLGKQTYSARENAVRRFEAANLVKRYLELLQATKSSKTSSTQSLDDDLELVNQLSDDTPASCVQSSYKTLNRPGLTRFLCEHTLSSLEELQRFLPQEQFGKFLYLESLYSKYSGTASYKDYKDYLQSFSTRNEFTSAEAEYLESFYNRLNAIGPGTLASDVAPAKITPLFCRACSHQFTNENVFKAHFSGKKHQKAAMHPPRPQCDTSEIIKLLKPQFEATIANIDRKSMMTAEERQIEVDAVLAEREAEDEYESDFEIDQPMQMTKRPLRGPEGTPIPRWLFKLHGLGTQFSCEICGFNVKYYGRKSFERHFTAKDSKHTVGLRQLGIQPSSAYTGISTINDALELKSELEKRKRKTDKEVEDDEGNVMSARMYEDLKRQGLI